MIGRIEAAALLLMCMSTLSGCFWDRGGGYGEYDRGGYGDRERGERGIQDRGEHKERY